MTVRYTGSSSDKALYLLDSKYKSDEMQAGGASPTRSVLEVSGMPNSYAKTDKPTRFLHMNWGTRTLRKFKFGKLWNQTSPREQLLQAKSLM